MDTNGNSKELLIKDLCSRLPYGVKCYAYQYKIDGNDCECYGILTGINNGYFYLSDRVPINGGKTYDERYLEVRPYLRPMSSMTEEEKKIMSSYGFELIPYDTGYTGFANIENYIDEVSFRFMEEFLNSHHFDYRGLIPMGLALEAPEDMYKNE